MQILISDIQVGKRRSIDTEKVKVLADSIEEIGLLNPITVDKKYRLIAGGHRLEAVKLLGNSSVECTVVDLSGLYCELAEIDENLVRNELHFIDRGEILNRRKEIYEEMYPETKLMLGKELAEKRWNATDKLSHVSFTEDTAIKTGESERNIQRDIQRSVNLIPEIKQTVKVMDLPKTEATKIARLKPKTQLALVPKLKQGLTVEKAITELRQEQKRSEIVTRDPVPLVGKYRVIYADPPWQYQFCETKSREIENQYPTMELEEIKQLKIPADDDSVLLLWATAPKLQEALEVMSAWGFTYKTCAVWDKEIIGMGYWFRGQHELLLIGMRGKMSCPLPENRKSSVYREKRTGHSVKPEYYYEMIESMFPNEQYIELFSRNRFNENWEVWGNQIE